MCVLAERLEMFWSNSQWIAQLGMQCKIETSVCDTIMCLLFGLLSVEIYRYLGHIIKPHMK